MSKSENIRKSIEELAAKGGGVIQLSSDLEVVEAIAAEASWYSLGDRKIQVLPLVIKREDSLIVEDE